MGKIKENDLQNILSEELNILDNKRNFTDIQKNAREIYHDTAAMEILASYNKKHGIDLQAELRAYLEPTSMEKIRSAVDGKDINEIKEQEQKEISKEVSSVSSEGVSVDKKEVEKQVEEQKQKDGRELTDENLKAMVLKAIYKSALEEFYSLKINLQEGMNGQLATGDISVPEKLGTKLVMYEKYLKNIDTRFKGLEKSSIIMEDDEIKKLEQGLAYRAGKNEEAVLNKNEDDMGRLNTLYEKRNNTAEYISYLSTRAGTMEPEKFKSQMDELQKEYINETSEIYNISPNPMDLQKSIESRSKDEDFKQREVGISYESKHNSQLGPKVGSIEKENDLHLEDNVEDINESMQVADIEQAKSAEVILEQYYEAEEKGQYGKAEELLQSLEMMADIKYEENEQVKSDSNEERTPDEVHEEEAEQRETRGGIFNDPRLSATNDENEIAKIEANRKSRQARAKAVEEKLNVSRSTTEIKAQEYVPTLNNRKGY